MTKTNEFEAALKAVQARLENDVTLWVDGGKNYVDRATAMAYVIQVERYAAALLAVAQDSRLQLEEHR